ncbi:MAG: Kelch repeat-containing protein, partial [Acidimicrobiales bacterium]
GVTNLSGEKYAAAAASSGWQPLTNVPSSINPGVMLLLTDGSVLVQDQGPNNAGTGNWWKLTPNSRGDYLNGTWRRIASMPAGFGPMYAASAVLPDGRVIVEGGELNLGIGTATNLGALYDPVANTWTSLTPPNGGAGNWSAIADAPSVVLANGTFMIGSADFSQTKDQAVLNASTLTWSTTGANKADGNGEEGWSLLPNGKVLTVDTWLPSTNNSEIYDPATGSWSSAGATPVPLIDPSSGPANNEGEIGPQLLMPNGNVFAEGSNGNTAIYDSTTGTWATGPTIPKVDGVQYDASDASSAILPNGDVLMDASPGNYRPPSHFFIFNGRSITQIPDPPAVTASRTSGSNSGYMLVLPTGQILFNDRSGSRSMAIYTATASSNRAWSPQVTTVPTSLNAGGTFTVSGTQLNGLTQGAAFGDDWQMSTNYPLVRITNRATGAVVYARTTGMTSMSVAPGQASSAQFTLPSRIQNGPSSLAVVASGFASSPVSVTVSGGVNAPAASKKRTIVCVRGKKLKRVTAARPFCPSGFKVKKR